MMGAGRGWGGYTGDAGWRGGHQHTAAKLMPFFFSLHRLRKSRAVADWQGRIQEVKMDLSIQKIICFKGWGCRGGVTAVT